MDGAEKIPSIDNDIKIIKRLIGEAFFYKSEIKATEEKLNKRGVFFSGLHSLPINTNDEKNISKEMKEAIEYDINVRNRNIEIFNEIAKTITKDIKLLKQIDFGLYSNDLQTEFEQAVNFASE